MCVDASTASRTMNWESISCNQQKPFICSIPVGGRVNIPEFQDWKCDEGWHYWSDNDIENCYRITKNPQPEQTAQRQCQDDDATLVSIASQAENDFITSLMHKSTAQGFSGDVWIGLKVSPDNNVEGKEKPGIISDYWMDGERVDFTNFVSSYPKYNGNKYEGDCVCMYGLANTHNVGKWANKKCILIDKRGVCKKPAKYDSRNEL